MTVGQMFIELLRLLEVGNPKPSKKLRSITIDLSDERRASAVTLAHKAIVISVYQKLAKRGLTWNQELTFAQQFACGELILQERLRHRRLSDEQYTRVETELNDVVNGLLELEVARTYRAVPSRSRS